MVVEASIADDCVKSDKDDRRKSGSPKVVPSDPDSPEPLSKDSFELVLPSRRVKSLAVRVMCVCSRLRSDCLLAQCNVGWRQLKVRCRSPKNFKAHSKKSRFALTDIKRIAALEPVTPLEFPAPQVSK